MSYWDVMTDGTGFCVVAEYLRHPDSPIQYILHVKEPAMLAEVAALLAPDSLWVTSPPEALWPALLALVRAGATKVSARQGLENLDPSAIIDATRVCPSAHTDVIFLPPFYLAYTPGLFEGKVIDSRPPAEEGRLRSDSTKPGEPPGEPTVASAQVVEPTAPAAELDTPFGRALEFIKCLKSQAGPGSP
jgi:hypothetical protein